MKVNVLPVILCGVLVSGCYSKIETKATIPELEYTGKNEQSEQLILALKTFQNAAQYCRDIHNNYEKNAKIAEANKLSIGATGGIFGAIGAVLAGAGTGGYFPGIASGLAGAASTTLGNAESGPLGTTYYTEQKMGIASQIQQASRQMISETDPERIVKIAIALEASCLASESGTSN